MKLNCSEKYEGLSKTFIAERQNLKNRRMEIILTNYKI